MAGAMGTPRMQESGPPALQATHDTKFQVDTTAVPPLPDDDMLLRQKLFQNIFRKCTSEVAKQASRAEREKASLLEVQSLTYGEMHFAAMHELLNTVKREHGNLHSGRGVFLDLGSGAGKAVISAGLLHPFERIVGIERLECLSDFAQAASEQYLGSTLPDGVAKPEAQFMRGDFVELLAGQEMKELAPQVNVCLAVSTCYGDDEMQALARFARLMPADAIIITFTQTLPATLVNSEAKGWALVSQKLMEMMWGPSTCLIYKKVPVTEAAGPGDPSQED